MNKTTEGFGGKYEEFFLALTADSIEGHYTVR